MVLKCKLLIRRNLIMGNQHQISSYVKLPYYKQINCRNPLKIAGRYGFIFLVHRLVPNSLLVCNSFYVLFAFFFLKRNYSVHPGTEFFASAFLSVASYSRLFLSLPLILFMQHHGNFGLSPLKGLCLAYFSRNHMFYSGPSSCAVEVNVTSSPYMRHT